MLARGRRALGPVVGALVSAAVLAGCGDVDAGRAYADELGAFLDTQDAVVAHEVNGRNDLPYSGSAVTSVTLSPELDPAEVVDASAAIVAHRTDKTVSGNDLTFVFGATGAERSDATTSFYLRIVRPLPDDARTRARLTRLVETAQAYPAADRGVTAVVAEASTVIVETTSDPFEVAPLLALVPRAGRGGEASLDVRRGVERVSLDRDAEVSWLADVSPLLARVRDVSEPVRVTAHHDGRPGDREPTLQVTLPADVSDSAVRDLQATARVPGVEVTIRKETPPRPTPTTSG